MEEAFPAPKTLFDFDRLVLARRIDREGLMRARGTGVQNGQSDKDSMRRSGKGGTDRSVKQASFADSCQGGGIDLQTAPSFPLLRCFPAFLLSCFASRTQFRTRPSEERVASRKTADRSTHLADAVISSLRQVAVVRVFLIEKETRRTRLFTACDPGM